MQRASTAERLTDMYLDLEDMLITMTEARVADDWGLKASAAASQALQMSQRVAGELTALIQEHLT